MKSGNDKRLSTKIRSAAVAVVILVAIVLSQFTQATDVTIHVETGLMSATIQEHEPNLIASVPVKAIELLGPITIPIDTPSVVENRMSRTPAGGRIVLKPIAPGSPRIHLSAEGLRLMRLGAGRDAHLVLYADRAGNLVVNVRGGQRSVIEVGGLGGFVLDTSDVAVVDASNQAVLPGGTRHVFGFFPVFRVLVFEVASDRAFDLVAQREEAGAVPVSLISHVKVATVDFRRAEDTKLLSEVRRVSIDPILREEQRDVFVILREADRFTLQSLSVSGEKIDCVLTGRTDSILVGKEPPYRNVVPSTLSTLLGSKLFHEMGEILKWLKGIAF